VSNPFVFGPDAKGLPVEVLSKNLNNPSSIRLKCKCGNFLGSLGQYKPDEMGRRKVVCKELTVLTPDETAEYLRRVKSNPNFTRKGCGSYLFFGPEAQVLAVIEAGSPLHTRVAQMEAEKEKRIREEARLEQWRRDQIDLQKKMGGGAGI
jgi:hypothetical protein